MYRIVPSRHLSVQVILHMRSSVRHLSERPGSAHPGDSTNIGLVKTVTFIYVFRNGLCCAHRLDIVQFGGLGPPTRAIHRRPGLVRTAQSHPSPALKQLACPKSFRRSIGRSSQQFFTACGTSTAGLTLSRCRK